MEDRLLKGQNGAAQVPVLLLVFNRPETTRRVFAAIRRARPPRLYVAADGPRSGTSDEARCAEVRLIATAVDWPCEVRTSFQEKNLGCRHAVRDGIDWFFGVEDAGVILEDDCVPDPSFFPYSQDLLMRFRSDHRVMTISGDGVLADTGIAEHSYTMSRYPLIWGWATWKRAWRRYDDQMTDWPRMREGSWLRQIGDGHRDFERYWTQIFDATYAGQIDSWAYRWTYSSWLHGGLSVLPRRRLVENIGFGAEATHTADAPSLRRRGAEQIKLPLVHPPDLARSRAADRWLDLNVFGTLLPWRQQLRRRVLQAGRAIPAGNYVIDTLRDVRAARGGRD